MASARQHFKDLRKHINRYGERFISEAHKIILDESVPNDFEISVEELVLPNTDIFIRFFERFHINNGEHEVHSYSYECKNVKTGFYIRYEKDPKRENGMEHPLCHIHVNSDAPRYPTCEIKFTDFFDFVISQFTDSLA